MKNYVKRRGVAPPGSIPAVLGMFQAEVRFYREIAPVVGVRVPECYQAEHTDDGTMLVLEDLSAWTPGADPEAVASALSALHDRWAGQTQARWPWLRQVGAGVDLVNQLFDETWPDLVRTADVSPTVRESGEQLVGKTLSPPTARARDSSTSCRPSWVQGLVSMADVLRGRHKLRAGTTA
jgi:hypothetical protein